MKRVQIKKVIGKANQGFAVLLGNETKTFVIFVGANEGAALLRELRAEGAPRPMTHDLLEFVLEGFDIQIKKVIVSNLVNNTFFATLILEQRIVGENGEWTGKRNEVRIDARPSDCLVLALKEKSEIWVDDEVFAKVSNVEDPEADPPGGKSPQDPSDFELDDDMDFDLGLGPKGDKDPDR
jgi:bifunctional DNase/RNase